MNGDGDVWHVTPSAISSYYFLKCDLFLAKNCLVEGNEAERNDAPMIEREMQLERGKRWEEEVFEVLRRRGEVQSLQEVRHEEVSEDQLVFNIRECESGTYLYQPRLNVPASLKIELGLGSRDDISLSHCIPDLILIRNDEHGHKELTVVEIKAARQPHSNHKIQVCFYSMCLKYLLKEKEISDISVSSSAALWLLDQKSPDFFPLAVVEEEIRRFFRAKLGEILQRPVEERFWHLKPCCRYCQYYSSCYSTAINGNDVSIVPCFPESMKKYFLQQSSLKGLCPIEVVDIEDIHHSLTRMRISDNEEQERVPKWRTRMTALTENRVIPFSRPITDVPDISNIGCLITVSLLKDYKSGVLAAFGIRATGRRENEILLVNRSDVVLPDELVSNLQVEEMFVSQFVEVLEEIYKPKDTKFQLGVAVVCSDCDELHYMRDIITSVARSADIDKSFPAYKAGVLWSLMFGDPEILTGDHDLTSSLYTFLTKYTNRYCLPFGTTCVMTTNLESCMRKSMALPIPVRYEWNKIVEVFISEGMPPGRAPDDMIWNQDPLKLWSLWKDGGERHTLRKILESRTRKTYDVLHHVQQHYKNELGNFVNSSPPLFFSAPSKYRIKSHSKRFLRQLMFVNLLESLHQAHAQFEERNSTLQKRRRNGSALLLRLVNKQHVKNQGSSITTNCQFEVELEPQNSWELFRLQVKDEYSLLLTVRSAEGERCSLAFNDFFNRGSTYFADQFLGQYFAIYGGFAAVARICPSGIKTEFNEDGEIASISLCLEVVHSNDFRFLTGECQYVIQRRYCNITSSMMHKFILDVLQRGFGRSPDSSEKKRVSFIRQPMLWEDEKSDRRADILRLWSSDDTLQQRACELFTTNQLDIFSSILKHPLSVVWGPPGTGKTYFLALALLFLVEQYRKSGRHIRIMVNAANHRAIENVMIRIAELQEGYSIYNGEGGLHLAKVGTPKDNRSLNGIDIFEGRSKIDEIVGDYSRSCEGLIVGCTIYTAMKLKEKKFYFDCVAIDEASQMFLTDSIPPLLSVDPQHGTVIILGDICQMEPVRSVKYPVRRTSDGNEKWQSLLQWTVNRLLASHNLGNPRSPHGRADALMDRSISLEDVECIHALEEDFRHSESISQFVRDTLYFPEYRPFPANASIKLEIQENTRDADRILHTRDPQLRRIIRAFLSPSVETTHVCVIIKNSKEWLREESTLVALLCFALKRTIRINVPEKSTFDEIFYGDKLFAITPHHIQRLSVLDKMRQMERLWSGVSLNASPVVDTVEVVQGREVDCSIVCFGVSGRARIQQEAGFLYDRNRFNVSITRARVKNIVILSEDILNAPESILDDPVAAQGYFFLRQFFEFCTNRGAVEHIDAERIPTIQHFIDEIRQ